MSDTPMTREEVLAARRWYADGYLDAMGLSYSLPEARRKAREALPLPPITRPREFKVAGRTWRWNGRAERLAAENAELRADAENWRNVAPLLYAQLGFTYPAADRLADHGGETP